MYVTRHQSKLSDGEEEEGVVLPLCPVGQDETQRDHANRRQAEESDELHSVRANCASTIHENMADGANTAVQRRDDRRIEEERKEAAFAQKL